MAASWGHRALEEALGSYQRGLRDRANRSIHQLKSALQESHLSAEEDEFPHDRSRGEPGNGDSGAWQVLQPSPAVDQLRALLQRQMSEESEASPPKRRMSPPRTAKPSESSLPAVQDLVPIINDQSQYIHHLEEEVRFCKEELSGMKYRIQVVVLENEKLQEELKSRTAERTLREQTLLDASGNIENSCAIADDESRVPVHPTVKSPPSHRNRNQAPEATSELEKWQLEMKLKLLYQERNETLEAQVRSLRQDLSESQKNCEDLGGRLRHQESLPAAKSSNGIGGLCLKCAQHEAVLSQSHGNVHMQTIERLTKERDDLTTALVSVRKSLTEMQQRESSAYEQVKQAVQMTEEANFEKMQALVHCKQLKNEVEKQKERLERELVAQHDRRANEKESMRQEMKKEREDSGAMMMALYQNVAQLEAQVERLTREKKAVTSQLEEAQNQLVSHDRDITKVCGEMRYQLNHAQMKRDEAEKEHREYRAKTLRELEMKDQEIEKLGLELSESKQRLEQAKQDGARAREEGLELTELLGKSEHQLHLTRLEKDSIQQSCSNTTKAQALRAQQREQELTQKMQQMETQRDKTENELYSLLTSQNAFLAKLKEECCTLAKKLEKMTEKSRSGILQLNQENEYMHDKVEKLQKRNEDLEEQCIQHGKMHERMKLRLNQLDKHCQATAQQLVQLLNKQNQLFRERQDLAEEVQSLRSQKLISVQCFYRRFKWDRIHSRGSLKGYPPAVERKRNNRPKGAVINRTVRF
ncbi:serologically defined colon cancer antigen 8 isoform X2 [Tachyglossus aculeatus]|uniref:serologically defined colon cancer antigen 8 isoform X2 n=1 Tax=Tachyglossus aculeatus TaxID=9261 RepID=UPI0018F7864D|nr:serologically defined colon cancer antigen 8 isoform X2 [Tachyglossus aculeatus]